MSSDNAGIAIRFIRTKFISTFLLLPLSCLRLGINICSIFIDKLAFALPTFSFIFVNLATIHSYQLLRWGLTTHSNLALLWQWISYTVKSSVYNNFMIECWRSVPTFLMLGIKLNWELLINNSILTYVCATRKLWSASTWSSSR